MAIAAGARLGSYEVVSLLGAGGMGEVYRARDTKLNRDVALKILPELFATDPERLARFTREAQTLAALNHPNIAQIYGLEELAPSGGTHGTALAMELVEGKDLSALIAHGPTPLNEALPIARQIADALEAAHEHGIIHRDLKPANIKVRPDGAVKVLDFGLAKALAPEGASATADATQSPTFTAPATQMGTIIGTAAYMAPEQARGKPVDKRADIWAFGVVLYEMLTGHRAFEGEETSDVLASVLRQDVDWTRLPADTPPRLRRHLARCLDRDPRTRLRDIGEARVEIAKIEREEPDTAMGAAPAGPPAPREWRRALPWALAGVTGVALVAVLFAWAPWRTVPGAAPVRVVANLGPDIRLPSVAGATHALALSPDGKTLAFISMSAEGATAASQLFVRSLDQLQPIALAGTEGAQNPFFSPDSRWIGFFASSMLKKVPAGGGTVVTLADAPGSRGGTWTADDTIVFASRLGASGLQRISAAGGSVEAFGSPDAGIATQRWPQALPGKAGILYTEHSDLTDFDRANLVIAVPGSAKPKVVVRGGSFGRYVESGPGYVLYLNSGRILAQRFDLARLETIGEPVPVLDGLVADTNVGVAQTSIASNGTIVYAPGELSTQRYPIHWMTRDGSTSALRATPSAWDNPAFSPDGTRLAFEISDGAQSDIFVYEWATDRLTQLTFDASNEQTPVWSPDGTRITFASDRASAGVANLYSIEANGTGGLERLTESPADQRPGAWHRSGKFLVFEEVNPAGSTRIMSLPVTDLNSAAPILVVDAGSTARLGKTPALSPDGQWLAYRDKGAVWVRPFPGPGGQWRLTAIDRTGVPTGMYPRWSPNGRELLFLTGTHVFVAFYSVQGAEFRAGTPVLWSPARYQLFGLAKVPYAVHPDGERLAIRASLERPDRAANEVVFVFNFFDELRRLLPEKRGR